LLSKLPYHGSVVFHPLLKKGATKPLKPPYGGVAHESIFSLQNYYFSGFAGNFFITKKKDQRRRAKAGLRTSTDLLHKFLNLPCTVVLSLEEPLEKNH
jgi:hypothetical protein